MAAEKEKFLVKETELQALLQERASALEKALAQREQVCLPPKILKRRCVHCS